MGMRAVWRRVDTNELEKALADPAVAEKLLDQVDDEDLLHDVDKAWQAIHFLLTGDAWAGQHPESSVVLGRPISENADREEVPIGYLTAAEVKEVAQYVNSITAEDLGSRYDAGAMRENDIYPDIWDEDDVMSEYILPHYESLREFYAKAASADNAILMTIG